MLATRPASSPSDGATRRTQSEEPGASAAQEEKNIPGVNRDALKEERRPLLDLDDVEQLESELAACFDAPPPPPLNIRRDEPAATVSSWTAAAEPRYVENRYVAPTTTNATKPVVTERRDDQQQQQQQATRVSDYSSLYSPPPHRATSSRQLYPALVPTAPSTDAIRAHADAGWTQTAVAPAPSTLGTQSASRSGLGDVASAAAAAAADRVAASARVQGGTVAKAAAEAAVLGGSSGEVVDELLSENERLRLIIQEMSEELENVSQQLKSGATATTVPPQAAGTEQTRTVALRPAAPPTARAASSQLTRYPGAQAEAARRRREEERQATERGNQQLQQQLSLQEHQRQPLRRGIFVHFKCDNCPQWLQVPGHAQLVYCPTCSHTSQMTAGSMIHFPPNNQVPQRATANNPGSSAFAFSSSAAAAGTTDTAAGSGRQEETGWLGYIKSVLAS